MPDQLSIYQAALRNLGETRLSSSGLTDERPSRYEMDNVWDDDFRDEVLEMGQWKFAMRTTAITYDSALSTPDFGYKYGFQIPSDYIRLCGISADEYFRNPLEDYSTENDYW